ncbi:MAG: UDP-N-acetylmuramoyl-L-alanine--D-glutamate ligase, partial [Desulfobacula sp.]|nr:UDP-N-acetylmuramoyl-L-alanine--D-glutamate ligase [Desulfobacula sp.]
MQDKHRPYYLIIGLGTSGISMAKFLNSKGYDVIATDIDDSKAMVAKELNNLGIKTQIGFHDQKTFNHAKAIIPSPGIPLNNKFIKTALNNGVNLTGELDIFTKYNDLPVIAITGTNGKTTVTTLIGNILEQSRMNPFVGGNIGIPLVEHLMSDKTLNKKEKIINKERHGNSIATAKEIIVAEISSFQLDISKNFKPDIGVLLNISQDHLDRYEDYADYTNSKWSIFKNQNSKDSAVINASIDSFEKKS